MGRHCPGGYSQPGGVPLAYIEGFNLLFHLVCCELRQIKGVTDLNDAWMGFFLEARVKGVVELLIVRLVADDEEWRFAFHCQSCGHRKIFRGARCGDDELLLPRAEVPHLTRPVVGSVCENRLIDRCPGFQSADETTGEGAGCSVEPHPRRVQRRHASIGL